MIVESKLNSVVLAEDGVEFTTSENLDVTARIQKGTTLAFTCRKQAEKTARQIGSYVYWIYAIPDKKSSRKFYGYAVPK